MLERLSVATFKGVRFACNDTATTVGRALIKHEFANSDKNNVEDQGLIPRSYQLTAIIFGDNYESERDQLLSAIESSGGGVLIHPFYGRIENAVALPVTFNETVKRLGRVEIPITFELSDSEGIPAVGRQSSSGITSLKNSLISQVQGDFSSSFNVTNSFAGNFSSAQDKLGGFISAVGSNVTVTAVAAGASAAYRAKVDSFSRNINSLIGDPEQLAQGVTGLIDDISDLYETGEQIFDVASRFFEFGADDPTIFPTTVGLIERIANNTAFNEAVKATALGVAYESSSIIDYRTVNSVDSTSRSLESVYRSLKG